MKTFFDTENMEFETTGMLGTGHTLHIMKDGFSYQSANGKVDVDLKFAEIGSIFLTGYCNSNQHYRAMIRDLGL